MATSSLSPIQYLRRVALLPTGAGLTDEQLLDLYVERQDDIAFEMLVRRHGPMVFGVCRRLLHDADDAEDAFQATFLVLVRKAHKIVPRSMVGNWLYGVASRAAMKARAASLRRRKKEKQVEDFPEPQAAPLDDRWRDLKPLLDRELGRLAEKYRAPIILCDIEQKTHKEAAKQLGWPEGTLSVRLMRGRKMLAKRLSGLGVSLSAASLAVLLSENAASAKVPIALVGSTVKAASLIATGQAAAAGVVSVSALALTQGVLKAMVMTKIKVVAIVLLLGSEVCMTGGVFGYQAFVRSASTDGNSHSPMQNKAGAVATAKQTASPKTDEELLQGEWFVVDGEFKGEKIQTRGTPRSWTSLTFVGDKIKVSEAMVLDAAGLSITFKLDTTKRPKQMTRIVKTGGKEHREICIYELNGDELKLCMSLKDGPIPDDFTAKEGIDRQMMIFQRNEADAGRDMEQLQGAWKIVTGELEGMPLLADMLEGDEKRIVTFTGDKVKGELFDQLGGGSLLAIALHWMDEQTPRKAQPGKEDWSVQLDVSKKPKAIDFKIGKSFTHPAIYHLEGDYLKIGFTGPGKRDIERPAEFFGQGTGFIILKRIKNAAADRAEKNGAKMGGPPAVQKGSQSPIHGVWKAISVESNGRPEKREDVVFMFDGKWACLQTQDHSLDGRFYFDVNGSGTFDFANGDRVMEGIYLVEGDSLRLCYTFASLNDRSQRPTQFSSKVGQQVLVVFKRMKEWGQIFEKWQLADGSRAFPRILEDSGKIPLPPPAPAVTLVPVPKSVPLAGGKGPDGGGSGPAAKKNRKLQIGEILIVGNRKTSVDAINDIMKLFPGDDLDLQSLEAAEKNLVKSKLFVVNPIVGVRPTVTWIHRTEDDESEFRDILVTVKEK